MGALFQIKKYEERQHQTVVEEAVAIDTRMRYN
jgi:hypothetical protein